MPSFNIPIQSSRPLALPLDTSPMSNALLALQSSYWKQAEQQTQDEKLNMALRHEAQQDKLFPYQLSTARTTAESGELNLENAKGFREEVGALTGSRAPNNVKSMRPVGADGAAPQSQPPDQPRSQAAPGADPWAEGGLGHRLAVSTADLFKNHILGEADPAKAEQNYHAFRTNPALASFIAGAGYTGDNWQAEAQHIFDDASARAGGQSPPPRYGVSAPGLATGPAPAGMPQPPAVQPLPQAQPQPPQQSAALTPADRDAIIRTVAAEARGEGPQGWQAVTSVILNRARATGQSPSAVVGAPGQFEGTKAPLFSALQPTDPLYQKIAAGIDPVLSGQTADATGGATHYFAPQAQAALGRQPPAWAAGEPSATIGGHTFFRPAGGVPGGGRAPSAAPQPHAGAQPPQAQAQSMPPPQAQAQAPVQSSAGQQALDEIRRNEAILDLAMRRGQPVPKAIEDRMAELRKSGQWFLAGQGFVDVPGYGENLAERKAKETTATKQAEYYDHLHTGLAGSAQIAAQQKQNIGIIRTLMDKSDSIINGYGTGSGIQQGVLRLMATVGMKPDAAANREVFNQTVARILADQFSGLKSMSSMTGESAPRVFQSMLHTEEKAINTPDDSTEGIRRKTDILDHSGDLMLRWGRIADDYVTKHGRLNASFDADLRDEIAKARLPGYEGGPPGVGPQAAGAQPQATAANPGAPQESAPTLTAQTAGQAPIGTVAVKNGVPHEKRADGWHPVAAPSQQQRVERAQMPPAERSALRRQEAAAAPQQQAQQAQQTQSTFDADRQRGMDPVALAQKYDGIRGQLRGDQQQALNEAVSSILARRR